MYPASRPVRSRASTTQSSESQAAGTLIEARNGACRLLHLQGNEESFRSSAAKIIASDAPLHRRAGSSSCSRLVSVENGSSCTAGHRLC